MGARRAPPSGADRLLGKAYDQYGTGGGWKKSEEPFENLLDCDSSRVYVGMRVRTLPRPM